MPRSFELYVKHLLYNTVYDYAKESRMFFYHTCANHVYIKAILKQCYKTGFKKTEMEQLIIDAIKCAKRDALR